MRFDEIGSLLRNYKSLAASMYHPLGSEQDDGDEDEDDDAQVYRVD